MPESLSPDGDLKQAERVRPSVETCSAQKGTKRWMQLLQSLLTMGGGSPLKGKPVVVLNLTGYIEDVGCAVSYFHSCVLFDLSFCKNCHCVMLFLLASSLQTLCLKRRVYKYPRAHKFNVLPTTFLLLWDVPSWQSGGKDPHPNLLLYLFEITPGIM